jgi:cysteine desulfurase / selenocysteine lyase
MSTVAEHTTGLTEKDVAKIRKEFPILGVTTSSGHPLIYLDNAATSQKPRKVIDTIREYYEGKNANVHRGVHYLSELATAAYEESRVKAQNHINAPLGCEIIFTKGTTEAINLVSHSYARAKLDAGDEILISGLEHHSNIVPWQLACEVTGAKLKVAPVDDHGDIIVEEYEKLLSEKTKIVALNYVSNALGTINPVKELIALAKRYHAVTLLDAAQALPHCKVDVQDLGCDFLACSAHKMFGPTGIGLLYGRAEILRDMPPFLGGGDMIEKVTFEKSTFNSLPYKFEAGTPNVAGVVGFGAAFDYVEEIGIDRIAAYEHELLEYGTALLNEVPGVRLVGTAKNKASVLSFVMESAHPHDIGQILNDQGIAVRAGHHCAQPLMQRFGLPATARASFAFYNTKQELDALAEALRKVNEVFA